jgi:hypothetical protein
MHVDNPLNQEGSRLNFDLCLVLLKEVRLQRAWGILVPQIFKNCVCELRDLLGVSNVELVLKMHVFRDLFPVSLNAILEFLSNSVLSLLPEGFLVSFYDLLQWDDFFLTIALSEMTFRQKTYLLWRGRLIRNEHFDTRNFDLIVLLLITLVSHITAELPERILLLLSFEIAHCDEVVFEWLAEVESVRLVWAGCLCHNNLSSNFKFNGTLIVI